MPKILPFDFVKIKTTKATSLGIVTSIMPSNIGGFEYSVHWLINEAGFKYIYSSWWEGKDLIKVDNLMNIIANEMNSMNTSARIIINEVFPSGHGHIVPQVTIGKHK